MIILDTHIWVWWVHNSPMLPEKMRDQIAANEGNGLAVSILSCWEIAKLVEKDRLNLNMEVKEWMDTALAYPGIKIVDLTPEICVASTQMPGAFHKDPADQLIVATAMQYGWILYTCDQKILDYPFVQTMGLHCNRTAPKENEI